MSNTIESIEDWPKGDTRILPFSVIDEDAGGEDMDITNADISWRLRDSVREEEVLSLDDEYVTLTITDALSGEFEITIEKEATEDISGNFREIIEIVDPEGRRHSWTGRVEIDTIE